MTAWTWPNITDRPVNWLNAQLRRLPVWALYAAGGAWPAILLYMGATGGLGVEPITALEHELGKSALNLLVFGLAITPLRRFFGLNLMRFRRAIGVIAFAYVGFHLLVWLVLDVQSPALIWADIVKRPYVTVGMAGFLLLSPLAATSNNWSVRRLGAAAWRRLHRLVYPAVLVAALHFMILVKGFPVEPLIYLAVIVVLLLLRLDRRAVAWRAGGLPRPR
ncbi:MAG: protein-methionine-sulfoxide reductase heme-binding subunit MsrQ [Rhodobacteraceae bacterium]|nr:protein-methionine-sulfoxide reductase heme-binding subunit MsrQ [Paracoccaceae bacterium]